MDYPKDGGRMSHVYRDVKSLEGHDLVEGGDRVAIVKAFAPGLRGRPTSAWKQGANVRSLGNKLKAGTAIATFQHGRYPHHLSGQHAVFFVASAGAGFWVMDQWKNVKRKPRVSMRLVTPRGKYKDGTYNSIAPSLTTIVRDAPRRFSTDPSEKSGGPERDQPRSASAASFR